MRLGDAGDLAQALDDPRRRPVHVLDQEHARRARRGAGHDVGERLALALPAGVVVGRIVGAAVRLRHADEVGEVRLGVALGARLRQREGQRVAAHGGARVRRHVEQAAGERVHRVFALPRAEVQHRCRVAERAFGERGRHERLGEPRLAHSGLRREQNDGAAPRRGDLAEQRGEAPALGVASHERPACRRRRAQPDQLPHALRRRHSADRDVADGLDVDDRRARAMDVVGDDRFACAGDVGQACGEVDRVAGHRIRAVRIAAGRGRHHLTAGDADVRGERPPRRHGDGGHAGMNVERGAQRARDVVAVRDRRAEYAHDRVADVLVDRAPGALYRAVGDLEVLRQDAMNLLGIEAARQVRVAGEVGKQDRDLPPLPGGRRRRPALRHRGAARRAEARAGRQRSAALRARLGVVGHRGSVRRVRSILPCDGTALPRAPRDPRRPVDAERDQRRPANSAGSTPSHGRGLRSTPSRERGARQLAATILLSCASSRRRKGRS